MFEKFPVVDVFAKAPRLAARSLRKVTRSELLADVLSVLLDVLLVLLDVPLALLIAETRLLKSDFSVLRVLSAEEVEELSELFSNSEIRFSSLLEKLE
ncbi:MAG: hypothetical protein ABSG35_24425 [Syntrophobacteraceae bacterium]